MESFKAFAIDGLKKEITQIEKQIRLGIKANKPDHVAKMNDQLKIKQEKLDRLAK